MKKIIKYGLIIVVLIGVIGAITGYYLFNKKQADLSNSEASFSIKADSLYNAFAVNEQAANTQYLNKIIDISGTLAEVVVNADSSLSLTLKSPDKDFGVNCNILHPEKELSSQLKIGNQIVVRGVCSGFNSIEVALNNCVLVSK